MNERDGRHAPISAAHGVDIVVPIYNAAGDLKKCVASVLKKTKGDYRLILIDDASPSPEIGALFAQWEEEALSVMTMLRNEVNLGFTGTANRGMHFSQRDVVLLNSDTIVTAGWLEALQRCAYSDQRIGTVTPFSNNAEICSYPEFCVNTAWPDEKEPELVREALVKAAVPSYPEIPTGVGFCLYIKRAVINIIGVFDEAFGAGYGEENDFCLRAKKTGFRNVLCDDAFVVHTGGRSFAGQKTVLGERNMQILLGKHPEYLQCVQRYIEDDPLRAIRVSARLEESKLPAPKRTVLHIVHTHGGGTESHARALIEASPVDWQHYLAVADGTQWRVEVDSKNKGHSSILRVTRREDETWEAFVGQLCATLGVCLIHVHNLSGCRDGILSALPKLSIPYGYTVHDLSFACPTITLLNEEERYCGGQTDRVICQACLHKQDDFAHIEIEAWRMEHGKFVQGAAFLIAPSKWAARMFERYFPRTSAEIIEHGITQETRAPQKLSALLLPEDDIPTVVVLGAVGPDKGARRLERLVALSREQKAPVRFVLIGYLDRQHGPWQSDDRKFIVHGRYDPRDLLSLLAHYRTALILYPSAGPETFSYTLSETWQAGYPAVVPPFGALAERMEKQGGGWCISPDEWRDESLMLQRIMEILSPQGLNAFREKVKHTKYPTQSTLSIMAENTFLHYEKIIRLSPTMQTAKPFSSQRIRDALGYREGLSQCMSEATKSQRETSCWIRYAVRFKKTGAGRVLYALIPSSIIAGLKSRM